MPVGAIARVATYMRGPGMTPRWMATFTSTSAYIAPSVSRSRMVVNPFIRALRAATLPRRVGAAVDEPRRLDQHGLLGRLGRRSFAGRLCVGQERERDGDADRSKAHQCSAAPARTVARYAPARLPKKSRAVSVTSRPF